MASNAAAYVAHGINAGVNRFADAMERQKDEEKKNAKKFKSLVSFAESSGLLSKDQAEVMDLDSLEGFVRGKITKEEMDREGARSAMAQMVQMQKMQEAESMNRFAADYSDFNDAYSDRLGAFHHGLRNNPGVSPQDLSAFTGSIENATPPSLRQFAPTELEKDLLNMRKAEAEGRTEDAAFYRGKVQKDVTPSRGMRVKLPDGTEMSMGGSGDDVTVGTQGKLEQDLINSRKTMDVMDELVDKLRPEDLGVKGVLGEHILDKALPMFGVKSIDPKRVENRTKLKLMIQGALRQISPDNRFTNEDRKRIEDLMPSTGFIENEQNAKHILSTIQRVFAKRNIQDLLAMGKPIALDTLSDAEIGAAVEMGIYSVADAEAFLRSKYKLAPKAE